MNLNKYKCQELADLTRDSTQVARTAVRHVNHYTSVFCACVKLQMDPNSCMKDFV